MKLTRFEELFVWQKSRDLSLRIYRLTNGQGFSRDFALRDQIRRASISVMSNIAEGFERYSKNEFRQFVSIARGSVSEVRSQLHLAHGLGYVGRAEFDSLYNLCLEISRMLAALHRSIEK